MSVERRNAGIHFRLLHMMLCGVLAQYDGLNSAQYSSEVATIHCEWAVDGYDTAYFRGCKKVCVSPMHS